MVVCNLYLQLISFLLQTKKKTEERGLCRRDFKLIKCLGKGAFGKVVLAKKKAAGGHSSNEEVFALKFVHKKHVSELEKEVLVRAVGHPFLVQLIAYFWTKVTCCFKHSMTMH